MSQEERTVPSGAPQREPAPEAAGAPGASFEALLEVPMPVVIEIGRTTKTLEELLRLDVGSVIELERMIEEPVDVFVGDRRLAQGQIVVVGERFGVRITQVLSSAPPGSNP